MTGTLIYLQPRTATVALLPRGAQVPLLNLCDQPVISATCTTLITRGRRDQQCDGLLAYQCGQWQHVNACRDCYNHPGVSCGGAGHVDCGEPQPAGCMHNGCAQPADIDVQCTGGSVGECDGCCWVRPDELAGLRLWTN